MEWQSACDEAFGAPTHRIQVAELKRQEAQLFSRIAADAGKSLLSLCPGTTGHEHATPHGQELAGGHPADTARGPRDECNATVKRVHHGSTLEAIALDDVGHDSKDFGSLRIGDDLDPVHV